MRIMEKISVMIVDDSVLSQHILSDIVSSESTMKVCAIAHDGQDALRKINRFNPDVILLDLEMPNMDGLTFLEKIKNKHIPTIIISSYSKSKSHIIQVALDLGAIDYVTIPKQGPKLLLQLAANIKYKILRAAIKIGDTNRVQNINKKSNLEKDKPIKLKVKYAVAIGSSTGGTKILRKIVTQLPSNLNASILVVQHMGAEFTETFANNLDKISDIKISLAKNGESIEKGTILIAPGDKHMEITQYGKIKLFESPPRLGIKSSINILMSSVAEVFGQNSIGIILSGMGQDGVFGLKLIKMRNGKTIAQDRDSSIIYGMAKEASRQDLLDLIVPPNQISEEIIKFVSR